MEGAINETCIGFEAVVLLAWAFWCRIILEWGERNELPGRLDHNEPRRCLVKSCPLALAEMVLGGLEQKPESLGG
jgi:hypothetical protein